MAGEFAASLQGTSGATREALILAAAIDKSASSKVPAWIRVNEWRTIDVTATIDGSLRTLRLWVIPDYFTVDGLRIPMWPQTAQQVADAYGAILASKKIARDIYLQAGARLPLQIPSKAAGFTIPGPDMETTRAFVEASRMADAALGDRSPSSVLVAGEKKDVVIGPNLDGSHVAIYGGAGGTVDGMFWQQYPGPHVAAYSDYSHGVRLVFKKAMLDGKLVDLGDVFTDPKLHVLVSDQGPFVPRFPSVGPGLKAIGNGTSSPSPTPGVTPGVVAAPVIVTAPAASSSGEGPGLGTALSIAGIIVGILNLLRK